MIAKTKLLALGTHRYLSFLDYSCLTLEM